MARIRTIKPEFWESESIGRLSMGARLLFLASLNLADDEGLLRWNEAYLSSQAFVYDELSNEQISEWMRELVSENIVLPYKAGKTNQRLAWIVNFRRHQVINRPQPSKLPPPSIQSAAFKEALLARDCHTCHLCGKKVDETSPVSSVGSEASSIDHLNPQSLGGSDYPSNLKTAHISCNKSRRNKPINSSVNDSVSDSVAERKGKGREGKKHMSGKPDVSEKFSPDLFEAFWTNWPATDRRTQKAKCLAKWKLEKLNDKADAIQQHVTALKRTEKWRNGFEPAPLTYLNGKQWEDGLPEIERQSAKEANDPVYQSLVEKFGSAKRRPDGRIYAGGRVFNADGSGGLCL